MSDPLILQPETEDLRQRLRTSYREISPESTEERLGYRQYGLMERAFRAGGGFIGGDELAHLLRSRSWQPISLLAHWIVGREVISIDWQGTTMLPLFQFDLSTMTVRPRVTEILRTLTEVLDDWELALWFAQPNGWLDDQAPVDVLDFNPRGVLDAARADRFIARG